MQIKKYYERFAQFFGKEDVYSDLVEKYLLFSLGAMSRMTVRDGVKRVSKIFFMITLIPFLNATLTLAHVILQYKNLKFQLITELIAIFLCTVRIKLDLQYIAHNHAKFSEMVHRFINGRKSHRDEDAREITLKHSRQEFFGAAVFVVGPYIGINFVVLSVAFREFGPENLPIVNFPALKLENHFAAWMINFLYQTICLEWFALPIVCVIPLTFLLMNNSCWHIDQTILLLSKIKGKSTDSSTAIMAAVKRSYKAFAWLSDAQDILQKIFFLEFSIMSVMLCMNFVTVLMEPPGTIAIGYMIFVQTMQFFVFCWLGQRVLNRIDELSAAIYDVEWYEVSVSDRKGVQLMLIISQNLRGFNGIFNEVNMETFLRILQFTYSLVMLFATV